MIDEKTIKDKFFMSGDDGRHLGEYVVLKVTSLGRLGIRRYKSFFEVRVEPASQGVAEEFARLLKDPQWKQPDDRNLRFTSLVAASEVQRYCVNIQRNVLGSELAEYNPAAVTWLSFAEVLA